MYSPFPTFIHLQRKDARIMDEGYGKGFSQRPFWLLAAALLVFGQAGLAAQLFGPGDPWTAIHDARPVIEGRHPLHLYHGTLGASTFRERHATTCYDPAFQAGYPKTPVFDGGARPGEFFLVVAGGGYNPAAYKLGLLFCCLLVPIAFIAAARGFGLSAAAACLAGVGGCFISWTPPVRAVFDAGHVDLLLAGLSAITLLGGLARYAAYPGVTGLIQMMAASLIGWAVHPLLAFGLLPIFAIYYLVTAPRHGLAWHLGLILVPIVGVGPNLWWLADWVKFWWLRQPTVDEINSFPCIITCLGSVDDYTPLFGSEPVGWAMSAVAIVGLAAMTRVGLAIPSLILATSAAFGILASRLAAAWPFAKTASLQHVGLLIPAVAVLASAFLISKLFEKARVGPLVIFAFSATPALFGWCGVVLDGPGFQVPPLKLGLSAGQEQIVAGIRERTTSEARILIEEPDTRRTGWNWTALLPILTERAYLGGIDPDAGIEHLFCGLRANKLSGRAFSDWTPPELTDYCKRYNVGWVLCRSPEVVDWWTANPMARELARFYDDGEVVLFELVRTRSFILAGQATVERADTAKLVLTDVVPNEAGEVVLSFHFQPELRVAPMVVEVTRAPDPHDPIAFLKLRLPGPVTRVTLTWEHP